MQDEHLMRSWNSGHRQFSADLGRGLAHLAPRFSRRAKDIGSPYGSSPRVERRPALSPAAAASLRGLAASVITAALWVVVIALAAPAPGVAASTDAPAATCACIAHLPFA